jgi:flagellar export protein FliJ
MKPFRFRLDQVLKWRETQLNIEKARLSAATSRLDAIKARLETETRNLAAEAAALARNPSGEALSVYGNYTVLAKKRIDQLNARMREAEQAVAAAMSQVTGANRNVKLLEKFKEREQERWQAELGREVEAFAAEWFLSRFK